MENPSVVLIIINYNGKKHITECLDSIMAQTYKDFAVVVVDNGSKDESVGLIRSNYPQVEIIENKKNLGFGKAINQAVRKKMGGDVSFFGILNNDIKLDTGWLKNLVSYSQKHPQAGILGGKILFYSWPRYVNSTGVEINHFGYGWDRDFFCPDRQLDRKSGPVLAVTGSAALIRRQVFEEAGLYDHDYFLYYEDSDLCFRTWKYTGMTVDYVAEAIVYHKFSASLGVFSPLKHFYLKRSRFLFILKNFPLAFAARIFPRITAYEFSDFIRPLLYRLDLGNLFRELYVYMLFLTRFPFYILKKLLVRRKVKKSDWWRLLHPSYTKSAIKNIDPESIDIIIGESRRYGEICDRILMGIDDRGLGKGWSNIINQIPRGRFVFGEAECKLAIPYEEGSQYCLQLHYRNDKQAEKLTLSIAGFSESFPLREGWNTEVLRLPGRAVQNKSTSLTLIVEGGGSADLYINEISILSHDSNLLRA